MSSDADNRRHGRLSLIAEIQYQSDSPMLTARISDISLGGLFIDTVNALELGRTVKFRLKLPEDQAREPITGEGIVTWRQETVGMGIKFTRMSREDWERIKAYIDSATE